MEVPDANSSSRRLRLSRNRPVAVTISEIVQITREASRPNYRMLVPNNVARHLPEDGTTKCIIVCGDSSYVVPYTYRAQGPFFHLEQWRKFVEGTGIQQGQFIQFEFKANSVDQDTFLMECTLLDVDSSPVVIISSQGESNEIEGEPSCDNAQVSPIGSRLNPYICSPSKSNVSRDI